MEDLDEQFLEGQKLFLTLEDSRLPSNDPEVQQDVLHALQLFDACAESISHQQLFSVNEELDDIRTDLLRFLLVPYYRAELQLKLVDNERLDHLNSAKAHFAHFLGRCEKLELVHKDDIKALHSDTVDDPTTRRATLIARMKREKEAKTKLETLQAHMPKGSESVDEEVHRSYLLVVLHVSICKTVSQLEMTEKEIKILEAAAGHDRSEPVRDSRGNIIATSTASAAGNNNRKPFAYTILPGGQRVQMGAEVFRPGFNMATMTPEQAYEAEVRAGRMVSGGGNSSKSNNSSDEEDEDIDNEAKVQKTRAWDNFKDDNPKGWGNTKK